MLAVTAVSQSADDPLSGLRVGAFTSPEVPPGWARVHLRAAALNHHDLWSLRGVGLPADRLPMVLGCDGAGVTDTGQDVVVHAVIADEQWRGDETLDSRRSLLSERHHGTFADEVVVPRQNLLPKPAALSWVEAACLPTAWLTAYRMLFGRSGASPGDLVLVQGAGGGVATALVRLGAAAGYRMWVTSRDAAKLERAMDLGAEAAFAPGSRLPERVDAVMESVGKATWAHSIRSLRPGGTIVVCGATSGDARPAELSRIFFLQLRVVGSTMGTRDELRRLMAFLTVTGVRPVIDRVLPLEAAHDGFAALAAGEVMGKVVFTRER